MAGAVRLSNCVAQRLPWSKGRRVLAVRARRGYGCRIGISFWGEIVRPFIGAAIILIASAASMPCDGTAFAQAGSTGGTLGKSNKSVSGSREESHEGSPAQHKEIKRAVRAEIPAKPTGGSKTFMNPTIDGAHVNWCMTAQLGGCGQGAADAWCASKGFSHATSFNWVVKSPAISQGDHVLCNGFCGAFTDVTCR